MKVNILLTTKVLNLALNTILYNIKSKDLNQQIEIVPELYIFQSIWHFLLKEMTFFQVHIFFASELVLCSLEREKFIKKVSYWFEKLRILLTQF